MIPAFRLLAASAAVIATSATVIAASATFGVSTSPVIRLEIGPEHIVCGATAPAGAAHDGHRSGVPDSSAHPPGPGVRKLGLIVWFHGGMRSQNREKGLEAHRQLITFVDTTRFVLASASAFAGRDWLDPAAIRTVDALVDTLHARYPLSDDFRLVGVSDGCLGVIRYASMGHRRANIKLLVSSLPQLAIQDAKLQNDRRLLEGRWDFFQGGRDRLFPAEVVVPFLKDWERLNPEAHLHFFPEGEHDFSYYSTHAATQLRELLAPPADTGRPKKPKNNQPIKNPSKKPTGSEKSKG